MYAMLGRRGRLAEGGVQVGEEITRLRRRRSRTQTLRDLVPYRDLGKKLRQPHLRRRRIGRRHIGRRRIGRRRIAHQRLRTGLTFEGVDETRPLGDESRKIDAVQGHLRRVRVVTV